VRRRAEKVKSGDSFRFSGQTTEILARLRAAGAIIAPEDVARVSPLAHAHVIPNGTYHFDRPLAAIEERSQALA
jgi:Tn3 transposase DDE domain